VRIAAVAVVLAPFALSVAAHAIGETTVAVASAERPALAFREYLLNFGRILEGQPVPGRFWFVNNGDKPLSILGLEPSSGCLGPQLEKRTYAPGEQGTFVVVADTAGQTYTEATRSGEENKDQLKEHFVTVRYDAGSGEETARVHLKFVLPARRIIVEPRTLLVHQFGTSGSGEPLTKTITVTDRRMPPARILDVDSPNDAVSIDAQIAEGISEPTRATIEVRIPRVESRLLTWVTISTDDPEQPRINVPIDVRVHSDATPVTHRPQQIGADLLEVVPRETVRQ